MLLHRAVLALTVSVAFSLAAGNASAQSTWYVDDNAPGDPLPGDPSVSDPLEDGSAAHPFDAIQEALDAAEDGDTVLLLDGTYTGEPNRNLDFGGRRIALRSQNGAAACVIDCAGAGRAFYFHSGEGAESILEGVTIKRGNAFGSTAEPGFGCGVYVRDASPTIRDCRFTDNVWDTNGGSYGGATPAGGGLHGANSNSLVENCVFSGNASTTGGAMYFTGSTPTIAQCTIQNNRAETGAGIATSGGSPSITGCTISGNKLAEFGSGGGLHCSGGTSQITECTITGNSGNPAFAGGVLCSGDATIARCRIADNRVVEGSGGGIHASGSVVIRHCSISGNRADDAGGVYHTSGSLTMVNCLIVRNSAPGFEEPGSGGGLRFQGDELALTNCTLASNSASSGADVYGLGTRTLTVANSILWSQPAAVLPENTTVTYSDVRGGFPGPGNIDADPKFLAAGAGDFHLAQDSPCINAGSDYVADLPADDLDQEARRQVCRVDMGAYESSFSPPMTDCNQNGTLDDCDIDSGASADEDQNHVPDECESAPLDPNEPEDPNEPADAGDPNEPVDGNDPAGGDEPNDPADANDAGQPNGAADGNAPRPPACGASACGSGIVGWVPLTLLGLGGYKFARTRSRRSSL